MNKRAGLTTGNVKDKLIELTLPMVFGILGLIIFNIVDTYFVSRLGTHELAALTFTFPVVLVLNSIALGIGTGTVSALARVIGEGNQKKIIRIATDSLALGLVIVIFFVFIGLLTIEPLFRMLGATDPIMPHIKTYMKIWYLGVIFVVIPMVGNNSIRALGDTKTPGVVMFIAALVNTILDPILIFGLGPFPRLEVAGAAIATVIARMVTFSVALYVLIIREKIVEIKLAPIEEVLASWKQILFVGIPSAIAKVIIPIGVGVITSFMMNFGVEAVAGYGVSAKIERFAVVLVAALAIIINPFVGQNIGAKKLDRVEEGMHLSYRFSIYSSLIIYLILNIFSGLIASIFSSDPRVIGIVVLYLRIVPLSYGFYGVIQISVSVLNALHKPFMAAGLFAMQMFVIYIPLSIIGGRYWNEAGMFGALALSYMITAFIGYRISFKYLLVEKEKLYI